MGMIPCPECEKGFKDVLCHYCNGSGEGRADGTTCYRCRGIGSVPEQCERCNGTGELDSDEEWDALEMDLELALDKLKGVSAIVEEILRDAKARRK